MESPNSVSSCESLYSVDSAASDEEDKCYDFGVFLSDSESEVEKEAGGLSHERDSAWTSPSLPGRDCKHRTVKPTSQSSARQRPSSQCGRGVGGSPEGGSSLAGWLTFCAPPLQCRELQGFIRPLAELLNGLKKGRYEQGLSSFQRSVAMDRIQRIVGVLQKPEMGERYLGTLLQVEMMLKVWFPHVALNSSGPDSNPAEHARKCPLSPFSSSSPTSSLQQWTQACFLADWSAMNLTWMHTSPICNPPLELANLGHLNAAFSQALLGPNACGVILFLHNNLMAPAPFFRSTSVTPDKSSPAFCHPKQPPGTGDPPRCQSLPGAMAARSYVLSQHPGSHSKSLPHLPSSSKEPKRQNMLGVGKAQSYLH
uniref:Circadian associated repressor of transcription n=1 Tax=Chelonoidis abingdonii TaxID=106734 RepID=A0A8C0IR26_CHEAB